MAAERLSRLQRRILAWLAVEEQYTRSTMTARCQDLVHALGAAFFWRQERDPCRDGTPIGGANIREFSMSISTAV